MSVNMISSVALAGLLASVAAAQTVEDSALATITGLKSALADALAADNVDTSAETEVGAFLASLTQHTQALASAIPANTAADPAATGNAATATGQAPASAGPGTVAVTVTDGNGVVTASQVHDTSSDTGQALVAAVNPAAPDAPAATGDDTAILGDTTGAAAAAN